MITLVMKIKFKMGISTYVKTEIKRNQLKTFQIKLLMIKLEVNRLK